MLAVLAALVLYSTATRDQSGLLPYHRSSSGHLIQYEGW